MRSKRATLSSPVTHNKHRRSLAGHASLLRLDLHRLARVLRRARNDNEIPLRRRAGALRNLTDGTMVLTMAAPAGFVMNPASGSNRPAPFGSSESASTNGCLGGSPVTAACTT